MATTAFESAVTLEKAAEADLLLDDDRRSNDRAKFLKHIHVRCVNAPHEEETGTMIDLSRDGLYFTARSRHYRVGMELRLNLPLTNSEWSCEIVRMEELPNGNQGIGVRILR